VKINASRSTIFICLLDFNKATFNEFINRIEALTAYRFFYDHNLTDSLVITGTESNKPVSVILDKALLYSNLQYVIYGNYIFITRDRKIVTQLPNNFFGGGKIGKSDSAMLYVTEVDAKRKSNLVQERIFAIGAKTENLNGSATIVGTVRDLKSGEPVIGVAVFIKNPLIGSATDQFGHFSITIPKGRHELKLEGLGLKSVSKQIMLYANGNFNIEIEEEVTPLKEVVVESERDIRVTGLQMGMDRIDIKTMKQIPLALGEADILKVILTLPGVQSSGEGSSGFNVRGGATNQNLILYNGAVIFNPSHLFGFFSSFNPDILKHVELYKSGITADYGGRISSVLDVHSREGNVKKMQGSGGISPITARVAFEGPLVKDRTSIIVGLRSTYSDWILGRLDSKEFNNSAASFYDFNVGVSHRINNENNLYLSAYTSSDRFTLNKDTRYRYSDRNASLKWKHTVNNKMYGVLSSAVSQYGYAVTDNVNPTEASVLNFGIRQINLKADVSYFPQANQTVTSGLSVTRYDVSPGRLKPFGSESGILPDRLQDEQAIESAVYVGDNYEISPVLSVYAGLRYSAYQNLGARTVYKYASGVPRQRESIQDSIMYNRGKVVSNYHGAEPRISLRYIVSGNSSVKISYNRMRQYIQMLTNSIAIAPTDIWKLSDTYIPPQVGDQYSIGFYKNLRGSTIETSVEAYYKSMKNAIDYKDGANLIMNHILESDILKGKGKAYGIELLIKKPLGKLNGWMSYTYSRSFIQTKGGFSTETINKGKFYSSSYDKPHALNFIGNYKISRRFNFSLNLVYSTGRPITLPVAKYDMGGAPVVYYSDRNKYRIPDYFRSDISINVEGNHKVKKLAHASWTFAVYNLTSRANVYSVYFTTENSVIKGYKLSIFAQAIPTVTYNFKF
jgi:hypothetical protein